MSNREQVGLGAGRIAADGSHLTVFVLLNPVYNVTLGLSPALLSTVLFLQRVWDAMADPLIGQFTDNFRSRWGRRLPLLAASALPLALLFTALWWFPRAASPGWLFGYLLTASIAFHAAHSFYSLPLLALLIEATDDPAKRTRLAGLVQGYGFAFQILTQWLFPLTQCALFSDTITGLRWVATIIGGVFLVAALLPVFLCRENKYARVAARQPRLPLGPSLRAALADPSFRTLLGAVFVQGFTYNIVSALSFYLNVYYVFGGDVKASALAVGLVGSSYHVAALFGSICLFPWLNRRLGKRAIYQIAAGVLMVGSLAKLALYQAGHPWLQIPVIAANGLSAAGLNLIAVAMLGDIVDADEWRTGLRREGLFASVLAWVNKAAMSLGGFAGGFLLVWIGFHAEHGIQSANTLAAMKTFYAFVPLAGVLVAAAIMHRYPLSEAAARECQRRLESRRLHRTAA